MAENKRSIPISLLLSAGPVALVAVLSSLLTDTESSWYAALRKPAFNPPQWAFPVAWSVVYLCFIVGLYLLLRAQREAEPALVGVLVLCGALNVAWSAVFFRLHAMIPAAVVLAILLCALVYVILSSRSLSRAASWLFVPHLAWGAFALALNVGFVLSNMNF